MHLNDDLIDIEKPDEICLPTLVVDEIWNYFYISLSFLLYMQDLHK